MFWRHKVPTKTCANEPSFLCFLGCLVDVSSLVHGGVLVVLFSTDSIQKNVSCVFMLSPGSEGSP